MAIDLRCPGCGWFTTVEKGESWPICFLCSNYKVVPEWYVDQAKKQGPLQRDDQASGGGGFQIYLFAPGRISA